LKVLEEDLLLNLMIMLKLIVLSIFLENFDDFEIPYKPFYLKHYAIYIKKKSDSSENELLSPQEESKYMKKIINKYFIIL
jgi:hypothetical protein